MLSRNTQPPPGSGVLLVAGLGIALSSACGGNVLLGKADPSYAHAIDRYARTKKQVDQISTQVDGAMFLQAEGLFRYRFEPPERTAGSYFAQAAAAALDLPVLQAFASSLDLFDLRLRTNDGAIQIWESMLERHPQTALRPLTLYRLGWAYRYRITPRFPREGPDEALDALTKEYPGTPLARLAVQAKVVPWKSQETATSFSILPGLGQIYAGENLNGAVRLSVAAVAAGLVFAPAIVAYTRYKDDDLTWKQDWPLLATTIVGLVIFSIDYTLAYQDALRAVMQYNEREERAFEDRHPEAP